MAAVQFGSPQRTTYKYAAITVLLTMTKTLARCADDPMIGYNFGMMT